MDWDGNTFNFFYIVNLMDMVLSLILQDVFAFYLKKKTNFFFTADY